VRDLRDTLLWHFISIACPPWPTKGARASVRAIVRSLPLRKPFVYGSQRSEVKNGEKNAYQKRPRQEVQPYLA
jgi:hypothetical protein